MSKLIRTISTAILLFMSLNYLNNAFAVEPPFDKAKIIQEIKKIMLEQYVFVETAKASNQHLDKLMNEQFFIDYKTPKTFARALTKEMRRFTNDKHIGIIPPRQQRAVIDDKPTQTTHSFDQHLNGLMQFRDGGFGEVNFFDGNVAYFRLDGFRREDKFQIDPLMEYLSTADAIIIDLRYNGGGGAIVNYLSSYFLPTHIRLSSTYTRRSNSTKHYKTVPVKGQKRLEVPLFILTSERTFSAAEAFSYNLQAQHRATVIGEATGGGAHPVDRMRLPHGFSFIVPYARSINPVTKTNWEGVGVRPDVKAASDDALEMAKKLAKTQATIYRETPFKSLEKILNQKNISKTDEEKVFQLLKRILARHHLEDFMVQNIAQRFQALNNHDAARAILNANVRLFPNDARGHHNYANLLAQTHETQEALTHYKLAVTLASEQGDRELPAYQKDLAAYEVKASALSSSKKNA